MIAFQEELRSTMKTNLTIGIVLAAILTAVVGGVAYKKGLEAVILSDFKVYYGDLVALQTLKSSDAAVLGEFLKARYYYLANRLPEELLPINAPDLGPVTNEIVSSLSIGKGPTSSGIEYSNYVARIESRASSRKSSN